MYDCTNIKKYTDKDGIEKVKTTDYDFTQATKLATIGGYAFYISDIGKVDLQNCKVKDLESFAFADCPYLDSVELGNSAQQAKDNSFAACPRLQTFRVYTTTTISKKHSMQFLNLTMMQKITQRLQIFMIRQLQRHHYLLM